MMSILVIISSSIFENLRLWFLQNSDIDDITNDELRQEEADDDDDDDDDFTSPPSPTRTIRRQLIKKALTVRIIMLLLMAISCHFIPDHDASGVIQFDMRFHHSNGSNNNTTTTTSTNTDDHDNCFALSGTYCDNNSLKRNDDETSSPWCAVSSSSSSSSSKTNYLQSTAYPFLLTPLTRWDSARFLRLALNGRRRQRRQQEVCRNDSNSNNKEEDKQQQCRNVDADADTDDDNDQLLFVEMEQSHAFFPLFPVVVQGITSILLRILPRSLLPSTCEGCLVLGAWLLNTIGFVIATVALYDMTFHLILAQQKNRKDTDDDMQISTKKAHVWSLRSTLAFLINPANVFFGTSYSESLFAALAFVGGAILARMPCTSTNRWFSSSFIALTLTTFCWWLATWTRSNGTLYYGYLVLLGIGQSLRSRRSIFTFIGTLFLTVVGAVVLMASSVGWHNFNGYQLLCNPSQTNNAASTSDDEVQVPDWCLSSNNSSPYSFNLYGYVQRKHWNVGLMRYYQWKQIPNFILASPIIMLAVSAVYVWIQCSWKRFVQNHKQQDTTKKNVINQVYSWAIYSLQEFASLTFLPQQKDPLPAESKKRVAATNATAATDRDGSSSAKTKPSSEDNDNNDSDVDDDILYGPLLLGHYAVLAAACLLGVLIAHVQISTRLICSTCPALYWHMAACITRHKVKGGLVVAYCFLYMFLGVILHSNWLPWT